jgi:hypothetical protein
MKYLQNKHKISQMWEKSQNIENKTSSIINKFSDIVPANYFLNHKIYETSWQSLAIGGNRLDYGGEIIVNFTELYPEIVNYTTYVDLDISEDLLPYIKADIVVDSGDLNVFYNLEENATIRTFTTFNYQIYRGSELIYEGGLPYPRLFGGNYYLLSPAHGGVCKYPIHQVFAGYPQFSNVAFIGWKSPITMIQELIYQRFSPTKQLRFGTDISNLQGTYKKIFSTDNFMDMDLSIVSVGSGSKSKYFIKIGENKYRLIVSGSLTVMTPVILVTKYLTGDSFIELYEDNSSGGDLLSETVEPVSAPYSTYHTVEKTVKLKLILSLTNSNIFKEVKKHAI